MITVNVVNAQRNTFFDTQKSKFSFQVKYVSMYEQNHNIHKNNQKVPNKKQ